MPERKPIAETGTDPARVGLGLVELPIAFGLGHAVVVGLYKFGCRGHSCSDLGGLGPIMIGLAAGVVVGIAYLIAMAKIDMPLRRRAYLDGAAALLGIVVYAVPLIDEMRTDARNRAQAHARARWFEALKRDAHAPPGVAPPMLDVVDEGSSAFVTNKGPKRHFIALARVKPARSATAGWQSCGMRAVTVDGFEFHTLGPGESARFVLLPYCSSEYAGAAIEYRVDTDPPVWWSDSAIGLYEGRRFPPAQ